MYCRRRRSISCVVQPMPRQNRQMSGWPSSHWALTSFLLASPSSVELVLSTGLTSPLPCSLYCSELCWSKRNAELLSETLTQDSTAVIPSSHASYEILGKSLHAFVFILYCDYLHLLSLPKNWPSSKHTWPLWLLLPHSVHSTKLVLHKVTVCSLYQSCNNTPADYLGLFLGRSLNSRRWSLHYIPVILLQVRFWKSCY